MQHVYHSFTIKIGALHPLQQCLKIQATCLAVTLIFRRLSAPASDKPISFGKQSDCVLSPYLPPEHCGVTGLWGLWGLPATSSEELEAWAKDPITTADYHTSILA